MTIISIDPGDKFVGIFIYCKENKTFSFNQINIYDNKNFNFNILNLYFIDIINKIENKDIVVIIENFINYTHKNNIKGFKNNQTSEMIGFLKHLFTNMSINVILQTPNQAKIWNNKRLIRLGLLKEINGKYYIHKQQIPKHTRDAYRHFIYYANKNLFNNCINRKKVFND